MPLVYSVAVVDCAWTFLRTVPYFILYLLMRKSLIKSFVQGVLRLLAFLARRSKLEGVSNFVARFLARVTVRTKTIGQAKSVAELGPLWQRSFPSKKQVPIVAVTNDTVIAEIHTRCPLRGSGDVHACYRMMEFDREVLRYVGGQFVVLESQATPSVAVCRVAMRLEGQPLTGLVSAHEQSSP